MTIALQVTTVNKELRTTDPIVIMIFLLFIHYFFISDTVAKIRQINIAKDDQSRRLFGKVILQ